VLEAKPRSYRSIRQLPYRNTAPKTASGTCAVANLAAQRSADMDPSHSGISNGLRPAATNTVLRNVRELRSCVGQPARGCLPRPYAAAWASARASTAANASAIFWWPASLGCRQSVPPTRSPGPSRSWSLPCEAHSSGFAPQAKRSERPLTSWFVVSCCPLLSPRFRRVAAPARPAQAVSAQPLDYAAFSIRCRTCVRYLGPE
jgi:hypothetical protein